MRRQNTEPASLEQVLAVPLTLEVQSCVGEDGTWLRRLAYEGLTGCVVMAEDLAEGLDLLERRRREILLSDGRAAFVGTSVPLRCGPFSYSLEQVSGTESECTRSGGA